MTEVQIEKCRDLIPLDLKDIDRLRDYAALRRIESCEYSMTTLFMWKQMYNPHVYFHENYVLIIEHYEGKCYSLMPLCEEQYLRRVLEDGGAFR